MAVFGVTLCVEFVLLFFAFVNKVDDEVGDLIGQVNPRNDSKGRCGIGCSSFSSSVGSCLASSG